MKASNAFKEVIQNKLNDIAKQDKLFAKTLEKKNKNIDDCITYILNQVKSSGCNGFEDDEIFNMAIHYYDEDNIKPGKPLDCKVVVNHTLKKEENKPKAKPKKEVKKTAEQISLSLF